MTNQLNHLSLDNKYPYIKHFVLIIVLLVYWCFGFYPFQPEMPIGVKTNSAEFSAQEGLSFNKQGIGYTVSPPDWLQSAIEASTLDITLDFKTNKINQFGPARILTLSQDLYNRNLTIGQDGADLIIRIRTHNTNLNGYPPFKIPNIIKVDFWHHIELSIKPGNLQVSLDKSEVISTQLPTNALSRWSPGYRLALGNEFTHNRPWLGSIRHAIILSKQREVDYAIKENLYFPENLMFSRADYQLVPFSRKSISSKAISDWVLNLFGFIPFGIFIIILTNGQLQLIRAIALCALLSLSIETSQLFLAGRVTSIDDLILNTLGGTIGIWIAMRFTSKTVQSRH